MPREINRLTAKQVRNAAIGMHADGGGLYLQATLGAQGQINASWIYRYNVNGKDRQLGLGSRNTVSLAAARQLAAEARNLRLSGRDPVEEKTVPKYVKRLKAFSLEAQAAAQAKAQVKTFDQAVADYIAAHAAGWRSARHRQLWGSSLQQHASPVLGKLSVKDITTDLVLKVLRPIWSTKPDTAMRVRGRIEAVLNFAIDDGDRANPARWKGHLEYKLDKRIRKVVGVKHFTALPYAELPAFMAKLHTHEGTTCRALEFVILTAARAGEVLGARWDEVDLQTKVWTIPGARMKAGMEHRVPLSEAAVKLLVNLKQTSGYVFPSKHATVVGDHLLLKLLKRRLGANCTVHGMRSSFRQWAAEETSFAREVVEMCLAHQVGTAVERAYQRSDLLERRRQLMQLWAGYCSGPAVTARVIPIRR
jgi:integrase